MSDFVIVENVTKKYTGALGEELLVLDHINWRLPEGAIVAVTGPSGSGKSTLLNLLGALDKPSAGHIIIGGKQLDKLDEQAQANFRAYDVGFVFQDHHLLPQLTALENVLLPTLAGSGRGDLPKAGLASERNAGLEANAQTQNISSKSPHNSAALISRAEELLGRVGLAERLHFFPARLSGGERQRVAIARALMNRPRLLLCDEPTGNLDQATAASVMQLLLDIAHLESLTVIIVTHNPSHAAMCEQHYEIRRGKLVLAGAAP